MADDNSWMLDSQDSQPQRQATQQDPNAWMIDAPEATQKPVEQRSQSVLGRLGETAKAFGEGVFHANDMLATTLLKGAAMLGAPGISPESVQATYDDNVDRYNKTTETNPIASRAGAITGSLVQAAAIPSVVGKLAPGLVEGAGVGSLGQVAKSVGLVGANAAEGAALGSMITNKGQDAQILLNKDNAATGAVLGAALTPFQIMGRSLATKTDQLEQATQAAEKSGYKGKIVASDQPAIGGMDALWKKYVNNYLSPAMQEGRSAQNVDIQDTLKSYIGNLAAKSGNDAVSLGAALKKGENLTRETENQLWNSLTSKLPNAKIATDNTKRFISNIVESNGEANLLSKTQLKVLEKGNMPMTPNELLQFKKDVWPIYSQFAQSNNKNGLVGAQKEVLDGLKGLYWGAIDDFKTAIGDNPELVKSFSAANSFTQASKDLFDPANRPLLTNALDDLMNTHSQLTKFTNYLFSKRIAKEEAKLYGNLAGAEGKANITAQALNRWYNDSWITTKDGQTVFDIGKALKTYPQQMERSTVAQAGLINNEALEGMQGLMQVMKQVQSNQMAANPNKLVTIANQTPIMNTAKEIIGWSALGTSGFLAKLAQNAPLKNMLMYINRSVGKNEPIAQLYIRKVSDMLPKLGVLLSTDAAGNTVLDANEDK